MSQIWNPEDIAGRILYGEDSLFGNGYYGSLDWYDKSISVQSYSPDSNTTVSYTNIDPTSVEYSEETLGTQTWN